MILTKQDELKLNVFLREDAAEGLKYLADILWAYYSKQSVFGNDEKDKGKAQLADWIKGLPKGLQDGRSNASN